MSNHRVPAGVFRSVATGGGDESDTLRAGQISKRRLLLYAIHRRLETTHPDLFAEGAFAAGWAALAVALRTHPDDVEAVLSHPPIGAWGMRLLRRLRQLDLREEDVDDAGYFGGIVAAALFRAAVSGEVRVRVRSDGTVAVPSVGRFDGVGPARWLTAVVNSEPPSISLVENGRVVSRSEQNDDRWLPVRQLASSSDVQRIDLLLDDVDPFRAPDELPIDDRLSDDVVARWQNHLDDAWAVLVKHHSDRAAAIARDVIALSPLRATAREADLSASSGESFGGVAFTTPQHGDVMAEVLVHEHQHIKLWSLLALVPLIDLNDERLYYAPWRSDPRPAQGLLQGAYAHLGLIQFWEVERHRRRGAASRMAHFEFARRRESVRVVLNTLADSGTLTDAGDEFVAGMRRALTPLLTAPVPALPRALADDAERETYIGWRLRNLRVAPNGIRALVEAWRADEACPGGMSIPSHPAPARRGAWRTGRQQLARERLVSSGGSDVAHSEGLRAADLAYAADEFAVAARRYADAIPLTSAPVDAWAGLALAHRQLGTPAAAALARRPEVTRAAWEALDVDAAVSPVEIAEWLSAGQTLD